MKDYSPTFTTVGSVTYRGATSGYVIVKGSAVAGDWTLTLPAAVPAVTGYPLTATTGGVASWALLTVPAGGTGLSTYDTGELLVGNVSGTLTRLGIGTAGQVLTVSGGTAAWAAGSGATFANPSASVGLTAVNGAASTAMRSDGAPALSVAIVPTWTGIHTFSNSTYSALFTGGLTGFGTATPVAGIDVIKAPASSKTFAKFGDNWPIYIVGSESGAGNPAIGYNLYYSTAWKFGKGSAANYGMALGYDTSTGAFDFYSSDAAGNADATATLVSKMSLSASGIVNAALGYTVAGAATSGYFLRGDGTKFVSAAISTSNLGSGTADDSKYLRGDLAWDDRRISDADPTTKTVNDDNVEASMYSFTVEANTLAATGDYLAVEAYGDVGASANNHTIRFKFAGSTIFSFIVSVSSATWSIRALIFRDGASTVRTSYTYTNNGTVTTATVTGTSVTFSNTNVVTVTAQGATGGATSYTKEYNALCDFIPIG